MARFRDVNSIGLNLPICPTVHTGDDNDPDLTRLQSTGHLRNIGNGIDAAPPVVGPGLFQNNDTGSVRHRAVDPAQHAPGIITVYTLVYNLGIVTSRS